MVRSLALALCLFSWPPALATADEAPSKPQSEEAWIKALRGSGSYQEGAGNVRRLVEKAYDLGAIAGASHWEDMHGYYTSLARTKGCQRGKPLAKGPVEACDQVTGPEPGVTGKDYTKGLAETSVLAKESMYPDLVQRVLVVLYDYGYVQGMRYGVRVHNDDIRLAQAYYRSCVTRLSGGKGEAACAESSKGWADELLARIRQELEAHGLPTRRKPK